MKLLFNPSDVDITLMKIFHYDPEIMIILCKNEILYRPIVCVLMNVYIEKFSKLYSNVSRSMKKITKFRGEKNEE